jgi:tetratricopeptide (TPR) repeat protein
MARPRFLCFALALVTLLVFLPVWRHGFVLYDDPDYITENRVVQAGLTSDGFKWAFTTWHASNWHPLTWLSHMLDCQLFGLDAGAHHLVNVLFHAASAALLLAVLWRMTGAAWSSALVAALFAWHPLRLESVAWAAERKDVLCAFFGMLTLWAYVRYVEETGNSLSQSETSVRGTTAKSRSPFHASRITHHASRFTFHVSRFYLLALSFFALGLLSKPMLVTLPFALLLLDYWPLKRLGPDGGRRLATVREKWPFFLLAAASCLVTFLAQRAEAVIAIQPYPIGLRLGNAVISYGRYLLKTIWPADLAVIYPLPHRLAWPELAAAGALLIAISWFVWHTRRQRPHLTVGWLWFLGMLVPVIGLVQVGGQAMADRYSYLPSIGLFIAVVFEARYWVTRLRLGPVLPASVAGLLLAGCLTATAVQLRYWKDTESLFTHALAVTTDNASAHLNLGVAFELQDRRSEALREYREAVRTNPGLAQGHNNLANLLDAAGNTEEAIVHYREALRLKPDAELAHLNLGGALLQLGRSDEAMTHYTEAARLDPNDPRPAFLMGKVLLRQGRGTEAVARFHDALRLDGNDPKVLTTLARVLAASEDSNLRNGTEAVALAQRANALTGGADPFALDTLAMACAEAGRFPEAREAVRKALAAAGGNTNAVSLIQDHLRLIDAGQPCREPFVGGPAGGQPRR